MKKITIKTIKSILIPCIVYGFFLLSNFQKFYNLNCIYTILIQSIVPTIMGYAISFGFICGVFDFTVGSQMIVAGLAGGILSAQWGFFGLILGCIITSIVIGMITGMLNWAAKIPSLVVTIGLTMIYEIIGQKISGQFSFVMISSKHSFLGGAPYNIIILLIAVILFYFIFSKTRFSYQARAVGNNEALAKNMGVKVQEVKFFTFIIGGFFLGVAALLQISTSGSMGSQVGLASASLYFKPLMGVMVALGLQPICNLAWGIFIAQLSINIIFIGLVASGLPFAFQDVTLGIFLLLVMLFSENLNKLKQVFMQKKPLSTMTE